MKKIEATVSRHTLDTINIALGKINCNEELIVNDVKGFDRDRGFAIPLQPGVWVDPVLILETHIELVIADKRLAQVVEQLFGEHSLTGRVVVTQIIDMALIS